MAAPTGNAQSASPPRSKVSILSLPDELLVLIIANLEGSKTWQKLCTVNKRLKKIAEELIYRSLRFNSVVERPGPDPCNVLVPRHVQGLHLNCRLTLEEDWLWILQNARNLSALHLSFLARAAGGDLYSERKFALLATKSNAMNPDSLPHSFSNIKILDVKVTFERIENVLFLFNLPNLEDLTLRRFYQERPFKDSEISSLNCKIRSFKLYAYIHPVVWTQLLSITNGLKEMSYIYNYKNSVDYLLDLLADGDEEVIPDWALPDLIAAGKSLRQQKDSLEEINIEDLDDVRYDTEFEENGINYCKGFGSFTDFPRLASLRAPLKALLNPGETDLSLYLPSHLKVFETAVGMETGKSFNLNAVFESLHKVFRSGDPSRLILQFCEGYPVETIKITPSLRSLEKAGVDVCLNACRVANRLRGSFSLQELEWRETDDGAARGSDML